MVLQSKSSQGEARQTHQRVVNHGRLRRRKHGPLWLEQEEGEKEGCVGKIVVSRRAPRGLKRTAPFASTSAGTSTVIRPHARRNPCTLFKRSHTSPLGAANFVLTRYSHTPELRLSLVQLLFFTLLL